MLSSKQYKAGIAVFIAAFLVCAWRVIGPGHNWGGDFALYISQCMALGDGTTSQLLQVSSSSVARTCITINPPLYPPGFPLMLLPLYKAFGMNLYAFKVLEVFCYLGCIACIGYFFYRKLGRMESLLATGLFATSVFFIAFCNNVIADIPVFFFSLVTINVISFYNPTGIYAKAGKGILTGILFATIYLTKPLSISLAGSYFLYEGYLLLRVLLLKKQLHTQRLFTDIVLPLLAFACLVLVVGKLYPSAGGNDYVNYARELSLQHILGNIYYYFHAPKMFLFHSHLFWLLTLPIVVYGMIRNREQDAFHVLFVALHFVMLVLWPFQGGLRYAFFLVPYYFYFSFSGYRFAFAWLVNKTGKPVLDRFRYAVFVIILVYSFFDLALATAHPAPHSEDDLGKATTQELFHFIQQETKPEEQFVFFKPNVLRLFCERESFYQVNSDSIRNSVATYWIHWKDDALADTTGLPVLLRNADFTVYRLKEVRGGR